jgi:uncharacterized protein with PIN domain
MRRKQKTNAWLERAIDRSRQLALAAKAPESRCPECGEPAKIIPSTGVCERCTEAAHDSYAS